MKLRPPLREERTEYVYPCACGCGWEIRVAKDYPNAGAPLSLMLPHQALDKPQAPIARSGHGDPSIRCCS